MPYVLTNAAIGEPVRMFFTDPKRFRLDGALTTDVAKALSWHDRSGPYRYLQRNKSLAGFRAVLIDPAALAAAEAVDGQLGKAKRAPRHRQPGKSARKARRKVTHLTKRQRRNGKAHLRRPKRRTGPNVARGAKRRPIAA